MRNRKIQKIQTSLLVLSYNTYNTSITPKIQFNIYNALQATCVLHISLLLVFTLLCFSEVRAIDKYMFYIARASRRISDQNNVWGG